ncbi:thermonuclease family protein [Methanotorris formicicus]|uniref:Nuclease (SNase domain-containing protein) n=1 Tax=Methanotorris formicicus Mc-S-70 TaxID=647171 RepID=H1L0T3_9EURY|nr:nuclease (SNase domain-containing protein) [Methanotorris formicicus Mc-S-70]
MKPKIYSIILMLLIFVFLGGCIELHNNNFHDSNSDTSNFVNTHEHYYGKVVKVVDGDTVYVNVNGELWKIRLLGVDTPETYRKNNPLNRNHPYLQF